MSLTRRLDPKLLSRYGRGNKNRVAHVVDGNENTIHQPSNRWGGARCRPPKAMVEYAKTSLLLPHDLLTALAASAYTLLRFKDKDTKYHTMSRKPSAPQYHRRDASRYTEHATSPHATPQLSSHTSRPHSNSRFLQ